MDSSVAVPLVTLVTCGILALGIPPMWDHGYLFYVATRVLDGSRLYVDIALGESHPPLLIWIFMVIEQIGRLVHIDGLSLYPGVVAGAIAVSVFLCWKSGLTDSFLLTVLVITLFPLAGPSYGQGEHLAVILAIPYLLTTSRRMATGEPSTPRRDRIAIGLLAAVGLALKPHFALVWLFTETALGVSRGWREVLRPESVAIGSFFVAYLAATAALAPEYFGHLPWVMSLYGGYSPRPRLALIASPETFCFAASLVAGRFVGQAVYRSFANLLSFAGSAMFIAVIAQGKGWDYHWYPVLAISMLLVALSIRSRTSKVKVVVPILALVAMIGTRIQSRSIERILAEPPTYLPQMLNDVQRFGEGRPVLALTPVLSIGFPLVNLAGVGWASPFGHLWMIPALYPGVADPTVPIRFRQTGRWQAVEDEMFDRLWTGIQQAQPHLIILQSRLNGRFDMRSYFETDARFARLFAETTPADTIGPYVILLRRSDTAAERPPG
jgi:hypothetical protein